MGPKGISATTLPGIPGGPALRRIWAICGGSTGGPKVGPRPKIAGRYTRGIIPRRDAEKPPRGGSLGHAPRPPREGAVGVDPRRFPQQPVGAHSEPSGFTGFRLAVSCCRGTVGAVRVGLGALAGRTGREHAPTCPPLFLCPCWLALPIPSGTTIGPTGLQMVSLALAVKCQAEIYLVPATSAGRFPHGDPQGPPIGTTRDRPRIFSSCDFNKLTTKSPIGP